MNSYPLIGARMYRYSAGVDDQRMLELELGPLLVLLGFGEVTFTPCTRFQELIGGRLTTETCSALCKRHFECLHLLLIDTMYSKESMLLGLAGCQKAVSSVFIDGAPAWRSLGTCRSSFRSPIPR